MTMPPAFGMLLPSTGFNVRFQQHNTSFTSRRYQSGEDSLGRPDVGPCIAL
jgi:hypothetical protein